MTAKEYLQLYRKYERYYTLVIEQIKSIDNEMISLKSPTFEERIQSSPKNDPIGDLVCALEKEKGKLGMRMTEYKAKMALIQRQIAEIDKTNSDYYTILLLRYILFKDWQFICDSLHVSRAQANRLNGQALLEFDSKFGHIYAAK